MGVEGVFCRLGDETPRDEVVPFTGGCVVDESALLGCDSDAMRNCVCVIMGVVVVVDVENGSLPPCPCPRRRISFSLFRSM